MHNIKSIAWMHHYYYVRCVPSNLYSNKKDECWAVECKSNLSATRKDCFGSLVISPRKRIHPLQCDLCIPRKMPFTKYTWSYQSLVSLDMNTVRAPIRWMQSVFSQNTSLMHEATHLFSTCFDVPCWSWSHAKMRSGLARCWIFIAQCNTTVNPVIAL